MDVLVWWAFPVAVTVLGIAWAAWVRRPRRPLRDEDTVAALARLRAAFGEGVASQARPAPLAAADDERDDGRRAVLAPGLRERLR